MDYFLGSWKIISALPPIETDTGFVLDGKTPAIFSTSHSLLVISGYSQPSGLINEPSGKKVLLLPERWQTPSGIQPRVLLKNGHF